MAAPRQSKTGGAPRTFIERYGLVQYTGRLGARYPREGPCELGLCRIKQARTEQWQAEIKQLLQTGMLSTRKATAYEAILAIIEAERPRRSAMLVFDHCHRHGWVRGLICGACNIELTLFEPEPRSEWAANATGSLLALVTAHVAKCPDC